MTANAYDKLVEAAATLRNADALADVDNIDLEHGAKILDSNRDVLAKARKALATGCSVPLKYETSFFEDHLSDTSHLRSLARAFAFELRIENTAGRHSAAAGIGVDLLELANAVRRGGLVTDLLVSLAIAGIGLHELRRLRFEISGDDRGKLISDLERLAQGRESHDEIVERDRRWELAVEYPDEPFDFANMELSDPEECGLGEDEQLQIRAALQSIADLPKDARHSLHRSLDQTELAYLRLLMVDLALRSYREKHDRYPDALSSLVPDGIPNLPVDPFTEQSLIYSRTAENSFDLYSTGPSQTDHGGVFGPWHVVHAGQADLCLDTEEYDTEGCATSDKPAGFIARMRETWSAIWLHWRS